MHEEEVHAREMHVHLDANARMHVQTCTDAHAHAHLHRRADMHTEQQLKSDGVVGAGMYNAN